MSEEEYKLLKIFKAQVTKEETEYFTVNAYTQLLYDSHKTVLNLIEKLQEENKDFKRAFDKETADRSNDLLELQKKDKMIDLMAEELKKHIFILSDGSTITSKKGIKEYYEQKAINDV